MKAVLRLELTRLSREVVSRASPKAGQSGTSQADSGA